MVERVYELLEQHRQSVYRYALNLARDIEVAEDLTQECMLAALKHVDSLREVKSIQSWLIRVTRNRWVDLCRKQTPPLMSSQDVDQLVNSLAVDPAQSASQREEVATVMAEMLSLPTRQREVMYLHVVEQLSAKQIAETLEISKQSVKSNLCAARQALRNKIRQNKKVLADSSTS